MVGIIQVKQTHIVRKESSVCLIAIAKLHNFNSLRNYKFSVIYVIFLLFYLLLCDFTFIFAMFNIFTMNKKFINTTEAAILLNMSRSHLYLLTRKGIVPSYRPHGRKVYYDKEELEMWITKNK